jgi:cell division protein FtsB
MPVTLATLIEEMKQMQEDLQGFIYLVEELVAENKELKIKVDDLEDTVKDLEGK